MLGSWRLGLRHMDCGIGGGGGGDGRVKTQFNL